MYYISTRHESDIVISMLRALGTHTPSLVFVIHAYVGCDCFKLGVQIFCNLDVGAYLLRKCAYRDIQHII